MKFNIDLHHNPQFIKNFERFCEENKDLIEDVSIIHLSQYKDQGRFNFIIQAKIWELSTEEKLRCEVCLSKVCKCPEDLKYG